MLYPLHVDLFDELNKQDVVFRYEHLKSLKRDVKPTQVPKVAMYTLVSLVYDLINLSVERYLFFPREPLGHLGHGHHEFLWHVSVSGHEKVLLLLVNDGGWVTSNLVWNLIISCECVPIDFGRLLLHGSDDVFFMHARSDYFDYTKLVEI